MCKTKKAGNKYSKISGGSSSQQSFKNWLWGVSDVFKDPNPSLLPKPQDQDSSKSIIKTDKGGSKFNNRSCKKGGLSSQLVPLGLLAGVLASRKKSHYHKRSKSKTRKGRLDFITHKGNKFYNRNNKRQRFNQFGVKGRPF